MEKIIPLDIVLATSTGPDRSEALPFSRQAPGEEGFLSALKALLGPPATEGPGPLGGGASKTNKKAEVEVEGQSLPLILPHPLPTPLVLPASATPAPSPLLGGLLGGDRGGAPLAPGPLADLAGELKAGSAFTVGTLGPGSPGGSPAPLAAMEAMAPAPQPIPFPVASPSKSGEVLEPSSQPLAEGQVPAGPAIAKKPAREVEGALPPRLEAIPLLEGFASTPPTPPLLAKLGGSPEAPAPQAVPNSAPEAPTGAERAAPLRPVAIPGMDSSASPLPATPAQAAALTQPAAGNPAPGIPSPMGEPVQLGPGALPQDVAGVPTQESSARAPGTPPNAPQFSPSSGQAASQAPLPKLEEMAPGPWAELGIEFKLVHTEPLQAAPAPQESPSAIPAQEARASLPPAKKAQPQAEIGESTMLAGRGEEKLTLESAAPSTPPGPELPEESPALLRTQVVQQVWEKLGRLSVEKGATEADLNLRPPWLGRVHIRLSLESQVLSVHIQAETASAREILQGGLAQLAQSFREQGLQLASLSLSQGIGGGSWGMAPQGDAARDGFQPASQPAYSPPPMNPPAEAPEARPGRALVPGGEHLVDYWI